MTNRACSKERASSPGVCPVCSSSDLDGVRLRLSAMKYISGSHVESAIPFGMRYISLLG